MKCAALALACALFSGPALAQDDPYASSQEKLFWSTANLAAAKYGSAASCGVITPGVGIQVLNDLLDYTQSQYGFTRDGYTVVDTYKTAYKAHLCSYWHEHPDQVFQVRQIGQQAMNATMANMPPLP